MSIGAVSWRLWVQSEEFRPPTITFLPSFTLSVKSMRWPEVMTAPTPSSSTDSGSVVQSWSGMALSTLSRITSQ
jgi:hypothetical protein